VLGLRVDKNKSDKIKAAILARKQKFAAQTIQIDKDWSIIRLDEMNYQIKNRKRKEPFNRWYYGTLYAAFMALPGKMLAEEAKNSLQEVYRSYRGIVEAIERVLPASRLLT
jgi:hypothetical protein